MTPEKVRHSLRRLKARLASKRRRHLAFLHRQTARLRAASTAVLRPPVRPATVEPELRHSVTRRPTRQEMRVDAEFRDSLQELELV